MTEYDKEGVVREYVTEYIRSQLPERNGILAELEEYARANDVPVIMPETAALLKNIALVKRPEKVLEVGCAIGYSSILLSSALAPGGSIKTLELDSEMVSTARANIARAGLDGVIEVIEADARDYLPYIEEDGQFDLIFLDGPKAHYVYMLDECVRLMKRGGILIADNVLYKGMTAEDEQVARRKITIVKRLRAFVKAIMEHPELSSSLISTGDGMTFSVKTV